MLSARKQDGTNSRLIRTAQTIAVLGAVQSGLPLLGINDALPEDFQWVYGLLLMGIGVWIGYLRASPRTSVPLARRGPPASLPE